MSKKDLYCKKGSFKYFIGHIDEIDAFPVPLCIKIPQMNGYVKYFNDEKCMNLLVPDKELLKRYNEIWYKISNLLKKGFDSETVYNDKYIKTKMNIYNNRKSTDFQGNKIPKDTEYYTCLSAILLDSVVKIENDYYP